MADKALVNLSTGLEAGERVTVHSPSPEPLSSATPLWQWIGEGSATVFSY
jgi:hypothetical protein